MTYAEFSGALDGGRGPSCVASGRGSGRRGGGRSERRSHAPLSVGPLLAGCRAIADVGASRLELDTADADALVPSLRSSLSSSGSSDCTAACCITSGHVVTKAKVRAVVDRAAASLAGRRRRPFQSREQAGAVATPTPPDPRTPRDRFTVGQTTLTPRASHALRISCFPSRGSTPAVTP